jgi:hypothetical protein
LALIFPPDGKGTTQADRARLLSRPEEEQDEGTIWRWHTDGVVLNIATFSICLLSILLAEPGRKKGLSRPVGRSGSAVVVVDFLELPR